MTGSIISFFRSSAKEVSDSAQELAEFYRVEASLIQAGVSVSAERGLTDEGDPWFVFCRSTDGDVILHFARVDGTYLIVSEVAGRTFSGRDFRQLLKRFIDENPRLVPLRLCGNPKLALHPAALLAAAVAAALFQMPGGEAIANEINHNALDKTHSNPSQTKAVGVREAAHRTEYSPDQQIAAAIAVIIGLSAFDGERPEAQGVVDFSQPLQDLSQDLFGTSPSVTAEAIPPAIDFEKHALSSSALREISESLTPLISNTDLANQNQIVATSSRSSGLDKFYADISGQPTLSNSLHGGLFQPSDVTNNVETTDTLDKIYIDHSGILQTSSSTGSLAKVLTPAHQPTLTMADARGSDLSALSGSQLAFATITNDLTAANLTATLTTLHSDVSILDIISFAASKAFGADNLHDVLDAVDHAAVVTTSSFTTGATPSNAYRGLINSLLQSLGDSSTNRTDVAIAVSQSVNVHAFDAAADAIVNAFMRENKFEILNSDRNVVLFDLDSSHYSGSNLVVQTWAMNDGSTISIVGHMAQQDLLHV